MLRFFIRIVSFAGVRRAVTFAALMESFASQKTGLSGGL